MPGRQSARKYGNPEARKGRNFEMVIAPEIASRKGVGGNSK
jgi:hypothetical protein